ncbi:LysR substrate-binding domain-containing protein [Clavibacter sp. MX14-G9D]|uniref:LysR substrate-binding domain-containing protein n=1 Tax=Clavibacter sp. MX14-G9D TaxID=3064656 RepID=UPI00293E6773|nr:LysR substrate-binding domain-containing protein [Clavibacter sp. MX14-G9D]
MDFCGQWALRDIVDGAFDRAAVVRNGRYEVNDVTVGFSLVEAGLGVMIVPEHLAERRTGLARLAIQGDPSWRIGAITPSRASSALAAAIVDLLV